MGALAEALGKFLAPILVPLIKQALAEFFGNTAEIAKPNKEAQDEASQAFGGANITVALLRLRDESDHSTSGNGHDTPGTN